MGNARGHGVGKEKTNLDDPILMLEGLGKRYPGFALRDVSFALPRGYIMALLGPNGAGKTTLVRIIMGLARADAGRALVCGLDSRREAENLKRCVGYVGEAQNFYDGMTAAWTANLVRRFYPGWDQAFFMALLARYGIDPGEKIGALSKGARVKFAIALALTRRPELLVLDEPTAGLDPVARREILTELKAFVRDERHGVLFSTHLAEDMGKIADYATFLVGGRVAECGEKDTLLERYRASLEDIMLAMVKGDK